MRIKEIIAEITDLEYQQLTDARKHRRLIQQHMKKLGYIRRGKGVDAMVYSKDSGSVIKIIVPESGDVARSDRVFLAWYKYCQQSKNKNNPHLPKFIEIAGAHHATFKLYGETFRQIGMEKLSTIPQSKPFHDMIITMQRSINAGMNLDKYYDNQRKQNKDSNSVALQDKEQKVAQQYPEFYTTMQNVVHTGLRHGFEIDIVNFAAINVMLRGKTPVIIDPWVL